MPRQTLDLRSESGLGTASANATNRFTLGYRSRDGGLSKLGFKNIEDNSAFTIFSDNLADTNQVDRAIIKP